MLSTLHVSAECKGHFPQGPIPERTTNVQKNCNLRQIKKINIRIINKSLNKLLVKTQPMLQFKIDKTFSLSFREEKQSVNQSDNVCGIITNLYIFDSRSAEGGLTFNRVHRLHRVGPGKKETITLSIYYYGD